MATNKTQFNVGRAKLCEWINFALLDEWFVQFGAVV